MEIMCESSVLHWEIDLNRAHRICNHCGIAERFNTLKERALSTNLIGHIIISDLHHLLLLCVVPEHDKSCYSY